MTDPARDAAAYLLAWHAEHTGATALVLSDLVDEQGRSSYDVLAATAQGAGTIVDLGCGDGPLLERFEGHQLSVGIDRSPHELDAAQRRIGHPSGLLCADAAGLPLPASSVALLTCHFALMLLQPLDAVLAEIARVLRRDGRFAAALPAMPATDQPPVWPPLTTPFAEE